MSMLSRIYLRFFVKSGFPYADYLKKRGDLHSQGKNCFISKAANISDPYLTSIGDNVWITSGCQILCHDASVIMINVAKKGHLDRVGPIRIKDNSFIGNNAIVLPDITIGSNTIIGAGSVVTKDVPDNSVYAGTPSRRICDFEEYVQKATDGTRVYPWAGLLKKQDKHIYDPTLEHKLMAKRVDYFFGQKDLKDCK
jgi:acetyltransferase-like isoleucine patch superfamily enzyme